MPRKSENPAARRKQAADADAAEANPPRKAAAKGAPRKSAARKSAPAQAAAKSAGAKKAEVASVAAKKAAAGSAKKSAASGKSAAIPKSAVAKKSAPAKKAAPKPRKDAEKKRQQEAAPSAEVWAGPVEDPIGDVSDGEAHTSTAPEDEAEAGTVMMDAYRADASEEAHGGEESDAEAEAHESAGAEEEAGPQAERMEAHLERLQKILSQAGIASRRHAEEMIVAGRVMVNGQVVTQLGAKADPARDHIRVDGKLLQGAERHRTFLLNKPKGYMTTVSDPEGRPTVMQFFEKMRERLYPVGRLDYQSEGLLLMTNDGELANALTRAAAGVEKTYLVKIAGRPGEEELEQLRGGVSIERDQAGSGRVRTAPAGVRQIRAGNNPWYEVVLTEGRNRELRKMFQAVGHFVEKIRRVGYGPLVLDVEPGQFRELTAEEVKALRLTAEGRLKPRRPKSSAMLPKEAGRPAEDRPAARFEKRGERRGENRGAFRRGAPAQRRFGEREESGGGAARGQFDRQGREGRANRTEFGRREFGRRERDSERPRFERPGGRMQRDEEPRYEQPERYPERSAERGAERRSERGSEHGAERRPDRGYNRGYNRANDRGPGRGPERGRFEPQRDQGQSFERGERPRFNKPRFERPRREGQQRGGRPESAREEFPRRGEFRRPDRPDRRPDRRDEQANRFPGQPSQRENRSARGDEGESRSGQRGDWKPRQTGDWRQRPPRREGGSGFSGRGRAGGGNPRRGPGSGAKPGGFRGSGFRGNRGGGAPRRGRG